MASPVIDFDRESQGKQGGNRMDIYVLIFMGVAAIFALGTLIYVAADLIAEIRNERDSD